MQLLREIDSPIPGPLRVAAEMTGTWKFDPAEVTEIVELARRLGASLHLAPVRHDVEALVLERLAAIVEGRSAAVHAAEISVILALAERLGLRVELWEAQNRLWSWAGGSPVTLDRDATAELARRLWFDPGTLLQRARFAPVA